MSKKNITRRKRKASTPAIPWKIIVPVAVLVILILTIVLLLLPGRESSADPESTAQTTEAAQNESQGGSVQDSTGSAVNGTTASTGQTDGTSENQSETGSNSVVDNAPDSSIVLERGLKITKIGSYTGIYMEDGSNETVSGLMMVILKNTGSQDLQLARFTLEYEDFTAEFEVTNLPAGASVVTLERNRRDAAGAPKSAKLSTVVFLQEKMTLLEDRLELSGSTGSIRVKNISDSDISGTVWVYYKYSAADILYGGITFRAKLTDGLKAGESAQIPAGHYNPNSVKFLWVTVEDGV